MCRVDDRMSGMCQASLNRCDSPSFAQKKCATSASTFALIRCNDVHSFILALRVIGVYASEVLRIGSRNKKNFS